MLQDNHCNKKLKYLQARVYNDQKLLVSMYIYGNKLQYNDVNTLSIIAN